MNGLINILKPPGMTSHDVISFIRKKINIKKVGHTGTLDPNAAGVLPICLGKGTKIIQYLDQDKKKYRCELTLGKETDTQDKYGNVIRESELEVTINQIINVIKSFEGEIEQIPPMYSAIKHKGKKLYELAREGKTIERKPRKKIIYNIDIINIKDNRIILFDVECSKGTYVRTLCNDIGRKLGTYGFMSFLLRTKAGNFELKDSIALEELEEYFFNRELHNIILPIDFPLEHYQSVVLDKNMYSIIRNGGKVPLNNTKVYDISSKYKIYCGDEFVGIGSILIHKNKIFVKTERLLV